MGDACLSIAYEPALDPSINARCVSLAARIEQRRLPGVRDVVPSYHTVAVFFDPLHTRRVELQHVLAELSRPTNDPDLTGGESSSIEIRVEYGGDAGPDLHAVAAFANCSEDEVVRLHTNAEYRVFMVGFLPGFAYLGVVDHRIAMPRLDAPRLRVPAGSVAIAGGQTGIYPCESPGGWRIIGRTSVRLFDLARQEPSLLKAGDRVTFVPVP
jgi:inhibitor of KinA